MRRSVPDAVVGLTGSLTVLVLLLVPASALLTGSSALGQAVDRPQPGTPLDLLQRAERAPQVTSYRGVQFVSAWTSRGSTSVVVEVDHRAGHGTNVSTMGTAAARPSSTFVPAQGSQPSLAGGTTGFELLALNYRVTVAGRDRVAGRATDVLEVRRSRGGKLAARFWLDRESALVLRREVYDDHGRATRASAFVELTVGSPATGSAEPSPRTDAPRGAWPDAIDAAALERMRGHGWDCARELPGSLQLVDARRGGPDGRILHLSYSDGLATVSVFEQRGRLDVGRLEGYRLVELGGRPVYVLDGAPARVSWSADGTVYTVVADAPPRTVDQVVAALPRAPADQGAMGRLGRGLDRVASWFNPFG